MCDAGYASVTLGGFVFAGEKDLTDLRALLDHLDREVNEAAK